MLAARIATQSHQEHDVVTVPKSTTYTILVVVVANQAAQAGVLFAPSWKQVPGLSPEFTATGDIERDTLAVARTTQLISALGLEGDTALGTFFVRQTHTTDQRHVAVVCAGVRALDPLKRKFLPIRLVFPVVNTSAGRQDIMRVVLNSIPL